MDDDDDYRGYDDHAIERSPRDDDMGSEDSHFFDQSFRESEITFFGKIMNLFSIKNEKFRRLFAFGCKQIRRDSLACRCLFFGIMYFVLFAFLIIFAVGCFEAKFYDRILAYLVNAAIAVLLVLLFTVLPYRLLIAIEKKYKLFAIVKNKARREYKVVKKKYDEYIQVPPPRISYTGLIIYFFVTLLIFGIMLDRIFVGEITLERSRDSYLVFLLIFSLIILYFSALYALDYVIRFLYWIWVKRITGIKIRLILTMTLFSLTIWSVYSITVFRFEASLLLGLGFGLCPGLFFGLAPVVIEEMFRLFTSFFRMLRDTKFMRKVLNRRSTDDYEFMRIGNGRNLTMNQKRELQLQRRRNQGRGIARAIGDIGDENSNRRNEHDSEEERAERMKKRRMEKLRRIQARLREKQKREAAEKKRKKKKQKKKVQVFDIRKEIEGERKLMKDDDGDLSGFHKQQEKITLYGEDDEADQDQEHQEEEGGRPIHPSDEEEDVYEMQPRRIKRQQRVKDDFNKSSGNKISFLFRCCYLLLYTLLWIVFFVLFVMLFVVAFKTNFEHVKRKVELIGMKRLREEHNDRIHKETASNPVKSEVTKYCTECDIERYIYGSRIGTRKFFNFDEKDPDNTPGEKTITYYEYSATNTLKRKTSQAKLTFTSPQKWKTEPVDLSKFLKFSNIRKTITGFNESAIPLNALMWYPRSKVSDDAKKKTPLVVIMHGFHPMSEPSYENFIWLGEYLASQGYMAISIDVTFLNYQMNFFPIYHDLAEGDGGDYDARALMVLYHLKLLKNHFDPNTATGGDENLLDPTIQVFVDWDNIVLLGHSRGGQAMMVVEALNGINRWPRDGSFILNDLQFNIQGYITLSPTFSKYHIHGSKLMAKNINHLMIWGGRDTEVMTPEGLEYFSSIRYDRNENEEVKYRKCFVYIDGANHGHYASKDMDTFGFGRYVTSQSVISFFDQIEIAKVYIGAFLHDVINKKSTFTDFFRDPRVGEEWLPKISSNDEVTGEEISVFPTYLITQYQDDRMLILSDFSEDVNLETTTFGSGKISAIDSHPKDENNNAPKQWSEGKLVAWDKLVGYVGLEQDAVFIKVSEQQKIQYTLDFSGPDKGVDATGYEFLTFQMSDAVRDRMKGVWSSQTKSRPNVYIGMEYVTVDKEGKEGTPISSKTIQVDDLLPPREYIEKVKFSYDYPPLIMQSFFIPFGDLRNDVDKEGSEKKIKINKIVFEIDGREQSHTIILSMIGLSKKNQ